MLSIVLGALAVAGVIVVAAHSARERRALSTDVRALRDELQRTREGLGVRRSDSEAVRVGPGPVAEEPNAAESGRSRTLH